MPSVIQKLRAGMTALVGALALAACIASNAHAQVLKVGDYSAAPGEIVPVQITVDAGIKGLAGAQVVLNTATVTPAGAPEIFPTSDADVTYGVVPPGGFLSVGLRNPSEVNLALVNSKTGDGPGVLFTIPFQVPEIAIKDSVYQLNITTADLITLAGDSIPCTPVGGTITVNKAVGPKLGDVNEDGIVTVADASLALRIAVGIRTATANQLAAGDLDGDGKITVAEVTRILRYAIGLLAELKPTQ